jgi:2-dehydro-3-deoxyphosphooctonate aldolase (KDO 8-P synthase)
MDFTSKILKTGSFPLLLGPCVIESEALLYEVCRKLEQIFQKLHQENLMQDVVPVFKASFDKANRTSIHSFRGPGLEAGLNALAKVKADFGFPVVSDIHEIHQVKESAEVLDILQIPAFLCRQTDLIASAASTGKVLNIKKGQFLSPPEIKNIVDKCKELNNNKVFICERGNSFGYNNLVVDMRMFEQARQMGIRTIFDATHSCQMPGAGGDRSLGNSHFAPILARSAVAAGATGLFAETHPDPSSALSDGPNMIPLSNLEEALRDVLLVRKLFLQTKKETIA